MIGEGLAGPVLRLLGMVAELLFIFCDIAKLVRHGPRVWRIELAVRRRAWKRRQA